VNTEEVKGDLIVTSGSSALDEGFICSLPPSASNSAKIAQFGEVMKKIWGVGCKGVQCSMMGELKQHKFSAQTFLLLHLAF
jgi:hypothetical protein